MKYQLTREHNNDDIVEKLWEGGEALRQGRTQVIEQKVQQGNWSNSWHFYNKNILFTSVAEPEPEQQYVPQ
jgi:hypothetical protein